MRSSIDDKALQYSSLFWSSHLIKADSGTEIVDPLNKFLHNHLLRWLEYVSKLGELQAGLECLNQAIVACTVSHLIMQVPDV